ncbi:hypothetical protein [Paenibacillus sp. IHB B 3415]|uniref:hypothetical protein n=1 Tax=Paenibacillus sp. IHB B 3415 TaxID=867080 RepID=UPI001364ACCA|nr:hypothetical protein [Paenibacillus sp. IHB B 3415]
MKKIVRALLLPGVMLMLKGQAAVAVGLRKDPLGSTCCIQEGMEPVHLSGRIPSLK